MRGRIRFRRINRQEKEIRRARPSVLSNMDYLRQAMKGSSFFE